MSLTFKGAGGSTSAHTNISKKINVLSSESSFWMREAYNSLRTNVTFSLTEQGCKVIGVTSSIASEGKSSVSLNLAISFSETKSRVLIIDADMRLPKLAMTLGYNLAPGLSDILVNQADLKQAIVKTNNEFLDFLPAGKIPPNPSELLLSEHFVYMIQMLKSDYDYIIIDTPPVTVVSDAVIISRVLSGVLLVARCNAVDKRTVEGAVNQLTFANAKILGYVFNDAPIESKSRYSSHYSTYGSYQNASAYADTHGAVK